MLTRLRQLAHSVLTWIKPYYLSFTSGDPSDEIIANSRVLGTSQSTDCHDDRGDTLYSIFPGYRYNAVARRAYSSRKFQGLPYSKVRKVIIHLRIVDYLPFEVFNHFLLRYAFILVRNQSTDVFYQGGNTAVVEHRIFTHPQPMKLTSYCSQEGRATTAGAP